MADSFNKKEREKKKQKKKKDKLERKKQKKLEGPQPIEFMFVDEFGNLTETPPDEQVKTEVKLEDIQISIPKKSEIDENSTLKTGTVKFFDVEKHYGFIKETSGRRGQDYFVHEDEVKDKITEGDTVTFEVADGPKGKIAVNVNLVKE